jgi:type IV pilus assembly protein PilQ
MSSFLRISALGLFAAAGVGIAVCVATSIRTDGDEPLASAARANAPAAENSRVTQQQADRDDTISSAPVDLPRMVPPRQEYAQQIPADPSISAGSMPAASESQVNSQQALNQLNELSKALLERVNAQSPATSTSPPRAEPLGVPQAEENEGEESEQAPGDSIQRPDRIPLGPAKSQITKSPGEGDNSLDIHIQNTDLRAVLDQISEQGGLNILASNNVQGTVSVSLNKVNVDTALAAILKSTGFISRREGKFIYVGTPQDILGMAQSSDRISTRVYRPNYVKASELQPLIMPLLTPSGSAGLRTSVSPIAVSPPAQAGIAADGSQAGGDTFAQNEVIVVRDYEAVLAEIDQVVAEIDKRPMQVAIEAMLLSVELQDSNSFGVDFQFLRDKQHVVLATGSPLADLGQVSFTSGGLKLGFLDSSLGAFLSALETIGDTNVIATPRLMCLNKHKAEILIGSQLGYVTKTLTQTTTTQAVDFLQVGTQLRLRPFISTDGLIRMEVHPEISTGSVEVTDQFTIPNKQVTQVTTNIMVRDGCTVVIGGLMQESLTNTGSQVPLLGSAPGIGFLFRNRKGNQTRTEIIVLITPHIVYEPEACIEGEKTACDFHREHAVYKDEMTPLNTRYLGRKFFRLAQNAWAKDDKKAAMRFINIAVHFDPLNRASVDLRSDIMAGNHYGDHTSTGPPPMATPADAVDGQTIAPWVLDHLENGGGPPNLPVHPRDPGQPGRAITVRPSGEFR